MLEVTNHPSLLPLTGPVPTDLNAFVSPAQNLVNGYNIAEQTCFHKTTVRNLIDSLRRISSVYRDLVNLLQASTQLVTDATVLVTDSTTLVTRTTTLLRDATSLVGVVTGLVPTLIGLITAIVGSLTTISTGALIAAIAAIVAGVACALFWVPVAGIFLLGGGCVAIAALLAVVFFVIRASLTTILGSLGGVTAALATLTPPLTTISGSIASVNGILSNPALPSDVSRSLTSVGASLAPVQNALSAHLTLVNNVAATLDTRVMGLQSFLAATPANSPVRPREHLEDTYAQAVRVYNDAITGLQGTSAAVWSQMLANANNSPQVSPGGTVDKALACAGPEEP